MKLTAFSISYLAVTHALAAVGRPRPRFQRSRLPNTLLTSYDCATYVAMYRMMKATGAPAALCAIPVVGAAAHFTYVLLQIPDGWYREYADNYEEPTLWNGLLLRYKMPAASIDAAFYAIGLGHLLASLPAKKTLLPVAVGALAGLAAWKPWAREEQPAKQEAAV